MKKEEAIEKLNECLKTISDIIDFDDYKNVIMERGKIDKLIEIESKLSRLLRKERLESNQ